MGEDAPDFSYLKHHPKVTDVVLHGVDAENPPALEPVLEALKAQEGIQAVRICAPNFWNRVELWSWDWIDMILEWQDSSVTTPFRVEMETWCFHSGQIGEEEIRTAREWAATGIDIYANVPLLSGTNTSPEEIRQLAHALRTAEVDFHHLYVAGLPCQAETNHGAPITASQVIAIASQVRCMCSGREIPLYMIRTPMGEVDFGLSAALSEEEGQHYLSLLPYDKEYFKAIDIDFELPETAFVDGDHHIHLPVDGLVK